MNVKKRISFLLAFVMTLCGCAGSVFGAEQHRYVNDGVIELSGSMPYGKSGDTAIITVVRKGLDFTSAEKLAAAQPDSIIYTGETSIGDGGSYSFDFFIEDSGEYDAYIGSSALDENIVIGISFINSERNEEARKKLLVAQTAEEAAEVISESAADLGISDDVLSDVDETGRLVLTELDGKAGITADELRLMLEKCALVAGLNSGSIDTLAGCADSFGDEEWTEFLSESTNKQVAELLSNKGFDSIDEFCEAAEESVILATVNIGNVAAISKVLTKYASKIGVSSSKITNSLCKAAAEKGNFKTLESLTDFIKSYKETSQGGGGSSGGGSSSGNIYSGNKGVVEIEPQKQYDTVYAFDDIEDLPWAVAAITELNYRGVLNGKEDRLFCPNDSITREEFAKLLTLAFKVNLVSAECPFEDVPKDDWAYKYVRSAYLAGVVNGVSETEFGYGRNITREDLCVMLNRMINIGDLSVEEGESISFGDDAEISDYARESVYRMARAGIVSGDGMNFNPSASATRAEAAKLVYSALAATGR